jgi:hypothetical protein
MMEGVNSTMIYCKNFCKCHNVPWYKNNIIKTNKTNFVTHCPVKKESIDEEPYLTLPLPKVTQQVSDRTQIGTQLFQSKSML